MEELAGILAMCRSAGALTAVFILVAFARRASPRQSESGAEATAYAEALVAEAEDSHTPVPGTRMPAGEVS